MTDRLAGRLSFPSQVASFLADIPTLQAPTTHGFNVLRKQGETSMA